MKAIIAALLLFACSTSHAQTREAQQESLDGYLARAGAAVDRFPFPSLQKWELVGPLQVVVWTRVNSAWLLTVDAPCIELEHGNTIALTSSARQVRARFDNVIVGRSAEQCRINRIRPIKAKQAGN